MIPILWMYILPFSSLLWVTWPQSPYSHSQKNKSPSSAMGYRHKEFADLCWKPPGGHHPHSVGQDTQISRNQAWKSAKRKSDWPWPPPVSSSQETLVPRGTPSLLLIVLLSPTGGEALSVFLAVAMIRPETEKPTEPRERSGRTETGDLHGSRSQRSPYICTPGEIPEDWVPLLEVRVPGGPVLFRDTLYILPMLHCKSLLFPGFWAVPTHCRGLGSNPNSRSS